MGTEIINGLNPSFNAGQIKEEVISGQTKIVYDTKPDEFVKEKKTSAEKKGISLGTKIAMGFGAAALTAGAIILAIRKGRYAPLRNLPENIKFTNAKTYEEAIEFGKKTLGIKDYIGFEAKDLNAINWINEGLVNVSNAMKGKKVRIPKRVLYTSYKDSTLAGVVTDLDFAARTLFTQKTGLKVGDFIVNKKVFDNLDDKLKELLSNKSLKCYGIEREGSKLYYRKIYSDESIRKLYKMILDYDRVKIKDFSGKVTLMENISNLKNTANRIVSSPEGVLKDIMKNEKAMEYVKKAGIQIDLDKFSKLTDQQKANELIKIMEKAKITHQVKTIQNPFSTIYHEMGHLQDMVPRCPTIDNFKSAAEYPKALQEWVNNKANQETAARVSAYATHGPGEFIAETFAGLVDGAKYPKEIMDLYKSLKGPMLPSAA